MAFSKLPETARPLLSFTALLLMLLANKVQSQDSISFHVNSFYPDPAALTYQRDAHVPSRERFLCLTKTDASGKPQRWSVGRVLFSSPVQFLHTATRRQASFETFIEFYIKKSKYQAADGIAFFVAPAKFIFPADSAGGNLGIFSSHNTSSLFAVEFDTYVNDWDPDYPHIGIDINSKSSSKVTEFENALDKMVTAHIKYDVRTRTISVRATAGSQTFTLDYKYNLRRILPEKVVVGISSSTGAVLEELGVHEIYSWNFTSILEPDQSNYNDDENEDTYIREYVDLM